MLRHPTSHYPLRWVALASWIVGGVTVTPAAIAQSPLPLGGAQVEALQGQAVLQLRDGSLTRPLRPVDWLGSGDRLTTQDGSQVDLHFAEGSWVRLGSQTDLTLLLQSRRVQIQRGTVLLIPKPSEVTVLTTPNAGVSTTEAALVMRYIADANANGEQEIAPDRQSPFHTGQGRTVILVLAASPDARATLTLPNLPDIPLLSGQMAIINGSTLYVFEFDTATFAQTSPLMQGFPSGGEPWGFLPPVQPTPNFEGEYVLNPRILSPDALGTGETEWLLAPPLSPPSSPSEF